jgi:multiple sugar transport system permease protein
MQINPSDVPESTLTVKSRKNKIKSDMLLLFGFIAIPTILMLLFSYYPALKLVELSFTNWNGMAPSYKYIGFENYIEILKDPNIWKVFRNNGAYVIIMLIQNVAGLYLAIILDTKIKAKNFIKASIFMPYILNGVAVAFMFSYIYNFENSPINALLNVVGLGEHSIRFLTNGYGSNFSLAFIGFWKYVGLNMVIYFSALQSISPEIYEASRIDGANFYHNIRYITLPNIKRMLTINLILGINGALQAYFEAFIMTKGGPNDATATFVTKSLSLAFESKKYGKASAMAVVLVIIIVAIVLIQRRFLKGDED